MARALDGLVLAPLTDQVPGQVGSGTRFSYHEADGRIWAEYAGGEMVRGHLVGTRAGDRLDFRYVQLTHGGQTASGHCLSTVHELSDGRVRLEERWEWESRTGSGTSVVEELPPDRLSAV
jgi:hypothetical protein